MDFEKDFRVGEWLVRRQLNTIENGQRFLMIAFTPLLVHVLVNWSAHLAELPAN